jgi:predicted acyl esterase
MRILLCLLPVLLPAVEDGKEWQSAGSGSVAALLKALAPGTRHEHVEMPMRDGVRLPTEILLPPEGARFPTALVRTPYGRLSVATYARSAQKNGCAVVVQDTRCIRGGPARGGDPLDTVHEAEDGYDCVEWIAAQPWSSGRVGMFGGSGNGMTAAAAYLAKPPHLVAVMPSNTAGDVARAWAFQNGVRRGMTYDWAQHRGLRPAAWPRPTLPPDGARMEALMAMAAQGNPVVYLGGDGWFNCFQDATLDWYRRFAGGRMYAVIGAGCHYGKPAAMPFPAAAPGAAIPPAPDFWKLLAAEPAGLPPSRLAWYVLGDPAAPTGRMRTAAVWPPPATRLTLHGTTGGVLAAEPGDCDRGWSYDPADPAPSLGGGFSYAAKDVPEALDQRPLLARRDVLRFATAPLPQPVEIAGPVAVAVSLAADVPDTALVAKLVHVLPDGREILLREGVGMARFREGFAKPSPLPAGTPVAWTIPIPDLGAVFVPGGRIALYLTSSSSPAFEVHPNTWEPATGPERQRPARLHLTACSLDLPVLTE